MVLWGEICTRRPTSLFLLLFWSEWSFYLCDIVHPKFRKSCLENLAWLSSQGFTIFIYLCSSPKAEIVKRCQNTLHIPCEVTMSIYLLDQAINCVTSLFLHILLSLLRTLFPCEPGHNFFIKYDKVINFFSHK